MTSKAVLIAAVSTIWVAFQVYIALVWPLHPMLQIPLHLYFALTLVFLYNPADKKTKKRWMRWFDAPIFAGIAFLFYYIVSQTSRLTTRVPFVGQLETVDIAAMIVLTAILLEAVRRLFGYILFSFIVFFIAYAWLGRHFPAFMRYRGTNLRFFTELMTMGTDGIIGTPLYTSASSLFYFLVFGAFFAECGGGQLLIDVGMKFSRGSIGGPAKAAVVSSGLMGMISGSAVANVATTGVITIPMMKKVGYTPEQAGAIEAVASTGGQIMPPIMGVGAFIMAEMLGISYATVAFSAIIPAFAYYFSVFLLVTFLGKKSAYGAKLSGVKTEYKGLPILPRLYLLFPCIVLVYYMVQGYTLMRSAMMGIFCCLAFNLVSRFVNSGREYAPPAKL